jgi:CheY-like chemotaxis protein
MGLAVVAAAAILVGTDLVLTDASASTVYAWVLTCRGRLPAAARGAARSTVIRVLLAEDQAMVRGTLASVLSLEDDIEVVAEVERGNHVLEAARRSQPDVALLDIELPGRDGIALTADLTRELPETRTLILTTFGRPGYLRRALKNGADGFLLTETTRARSRSGRVG